MKKKILSLITILSLVVGTLGISFADANQTPDDRANSLLKAGIISGFGDGTLGLEKAITRAEFSSMLAKIIVDDEKEMEKYTNHSHFSDIEGDSWAAASINILFDKGIVNGYKDGTFRPKNEISFNEIIVMVVRSMDEEFEEGKTWYEGYVKRAKELGLLENIKAEDYSNSAKRQDVVDIIFNTLELNK